MQVAAAEVEPFGEDRADVRAAVNTEAILLKECGDRAVIERSWDLLRDYADNGPGNDQNELPADPDILAKLSESRG